MIRGGMPLIEFTSPKGVMKFEEAFIGNDYGGMPAADRLFRQAGR